MLTRLYHYTIAFANKPTAIIALAIIAFVESSVFPIPPHALLIPLIIAAPHRAFFFATITTIASVLGGALGYYIGAELFGAIGQPILDFYGKTAAFGEFQTEFQKHGHWAVLFAGITPFPYKVITITSGAAGLPFGEFMIWSLIARGLIFFAIASLLRVFGETIRDFIEKRLGWVIMAFCLALVGGFYVIRYL